MLVNGNALQIPLADGVVHLIVTSPPYFNAREEYAKWDTYQDYLSDMIKVWQECYRVLCDGGRIAVNTPQGYDRPGSGGYKNIGDDTARALCATGFELRGHIIWSKGRYPQSRGTAWGSWMSASNPSLRDEHEIIIVAHKGNPRREPVGISTIDAETFLESTKSVWEIQPVQSHWHPAPFPPEIPRRLIELYSYKGDIILDPFSGSGTTVTVANQLERVGIGIDYSLDYLYRARLEEAYQFGDWEIAKQLMYKRAKVELSDLPLWNTSG